MTFGTDKSQRHTLKNDRNVHIFVILCKTSFITRLISVVSKPNKIMFVVEDFVVFVFVKKTRPKMILIQGLSTIRENVKSHLGRPAHAA